MASEFLGLRMVVTVRNGERLCGSISGVAAGQSLTLSDGVCPPPLAFGLLELVINSLPLCGCPSYSVVSRQRRLATASNH